MNGRIVDLTKKVSPGRAEGPVGAGKRKYEIREFRYPPGEIMHFIDMESHISTHVEAPSRFVPVRHGRLAHDVSEVALDRLRKTRFLFFGFPAAMGGLESFPIRAVAIEAD